MPETVNSAEVDRVWNFGGEDITYITGAKVYIIFSF